MSEISKITLPNGKEYDLKDTTARNAANSAVPNTRTVNGKALSSDISLGAGDVGAYTKKETDTKINAAIASAYKYKGSVTADKLPTSGQVVGDVYNITNDSSYGKAGMNVAWTGTTWDALGSNVDLSNYVTTSDSRLSNARPASDVYAWAKAAKKPSYSASEINGLGSLATKNGLSAGDVGALPTSGGTMTGDIAFAATGTTGTSNKISFSGSTDGAQIYYNVPSSDQGNLIFNMTDDTNAYIQFAQNGTVHSYISPADGTYHGNISGSAGSVAWSNVSDKPSTYSPSSHTHTKAQVGLGNVDNVSKSSILQSVYPAGAIYMSMSSTSPASLFGGTWEQLKDRFLLAAGDTYEAGSTGGEAQHTLTVDEMPIHDHDIRNVLVNSTSGIHVIIGSGSGIISYSPEEGLNKTNTTGRSQAHNNMPPYLTVYMWKRIA